MDRFPYEQLVEENLIIENEQENSDSATIAS